MGDYQTGDTPDCCDEANVDVSFVVADDVDGVDEDGFYLATGGADEPTYRRVRFCPDCGAAIDPEVEG